MSTAPASHPNSGGLVEVLRHACRERGSQPWLTTPRHTRTPDEIWSEAARVAHGLQSEGLRPGDRVALVLGNGVEFLQAWFGVLMAGGTVVSINTGFLADEIGYVLKHCGARFAFVEPATESATRAAAATIDDCALVVSGARQVTTDDLTLETWLAGTEIGGDRIHLPVPEETAAVLYTSGTTGPPKGCRLGPDYHRHAAAAVVKHLDLGPADVMLCVLPLFHMNAQTSSVTGSLLSGAKLILEDRFSATRFWSIVHRFGVTEFNYLGIVSAALMKQSQSKTDRDHTLRVGFGAGMPPALHTAFEERFGFPMVEVFGMTETGLDMAVPLDGDRRTGSGTMGLPVPGRQARIMTPEGAPAPEGVPGELQLRGSGLFQGYLNDPPATAAAFQDGWFRTGDLAVRDEDGWYRYVDRLKDLVRRAGENISSAEVESILCAHHGVREAAVIGVAEDVVGQEVKAVLVLQPGYDSTPSLMEDILRHCAERLAAFKVPRYLEIVDTLPRTASQKISKAALRSQPHGTTADYERTWKPERPQ